MENVGKNLRYLRKKKGMTQDDLAKKMAVSRYKIGSYEEGRATPKLSLLQFIADYFKLSIDSLVNFKLWEEEPQVIGHSYSDAAKLRVLTTVVDQKNRERFSIVPQKASAGYTSGYSDPAFIEKLPVFDFPLPEFSNDRTYRVFQITGDSMAPVPSGSYIICEYVLNEIDIKYGEPHVVVTKNEGIVYKRIEKEPDDNRTIILRSDNTEYKAYTINWDEVLEIWKAVGIIFTQLPCKNDIAFSNIQRLISDLKNELEQFKET